MHITMYIGICSIKHYAHYNVQRDLGDKLIVSRTKKFRLFMKQRHVLSSCAHIVISYLKKYIYIIDKKIFY